MLERENKDGKFFEMPGYGIIEFQPNSIIEEVAIELVHLRLEAAKKKKEVEILETAVEQKWEQLTNVVLESKIEPPLLESVCQVGFISGSNEST